MLRLRKKACRQLDQYGYKWKMNEGELLVSKRDCSFRIRFYDTLDRFVKNVCVDYFFSDSGLTGANTDVLNAIICKVNYDNVDIKFLQMEDGCFLCRFEIPMLRMSRFVKIFEYGFEKISAAVGEFFDGVEAMKQDLKPATNSIGFIRPEREPETKVVAETKRNE